MLLQKLNDNKEKDDTKNEEPEKVETTVEKKQELNYDADKETDQLEAPVLPETNQSQAVKPKRVQTEKQKLAFIKCMERRKAQCEKIKNMKEDEKLKEKIEKKAKKMKDIFKSDEMKQVILQIYKSQRESEKAAKVKKPSFDELINTDEFSEKVKNVVIQVKQENKLRKQQEKRAEEVKEEETKFETKIKETERKPAVQLPEVIINPFAGFNFL